MVKGIMISVQKCTFPERALKQVAASFFWVGTEREVSGDKLEGQ